MWILLVGVIGFLLFFLYDILQILDSQKAKGAMFTLGMLLLFFSSFGLILLRCQKNGFAFRPILLLPALFVILFFVLLIHSLFFALPADTYQQVEGERTLVSNGVYALCRHPGVLWFTGLYLSLWFFFGGGLLLSAAILYSLLNLAYASMQDVWVFPKQFGGYAEYRKQTPFLIPNPRSIRACFDTWNT